MQGAVSLAQRHPDVWAAVGIHPHDADERDSLMSPMLSLLNEPRVVALGEIGLDYHYDHSPRDLQKSVFAECIAVARERHKPVVIHTRSAAGDTLELLRTEGVSAVGGILHCFSEDVAFARAALDLGLYLSFSGIVTFPRSEAIREAAQFCPSERLLVETDSPYLAPVPKRRAWPCEPGWVVHTGRFLAELRGETELELAAQSTRNAERVFGLTSRN